MAFIDYFHVSNYHLLAALKFVFLAQTFPLNLMYIYITSSLTFWMSNRYFKLKFHLSAGSVESTVKTYLNFYMFFFLSPALLWFQLLPSIAWWGNSPLTGFPAFIVACWQFVLNKATVSLSTCKPKFCSSFCRIIQWLHAFLREKDEVL